jgi:integrase
MAHCGWNDESIPPSVVASSPPSQASHDLRHTVAFQPATAMGADADELERLFGHRSQRYIQRSTNPPEAIAAYIEEF